MSNVSQPSGKSPWKRYVVTRDDTKVGQINVFKVGKQLEFQLNAETADALDQLRAILTEGKQAEKRARKAATRKGTKKVKKALNGEAVRRALATRFKKHGYDLKALPKSDFQMNVEINTDSGRRVGAVSKLHAFARSSEVERRVYDALGNVGKTSRAKLEKDVREALAGGKPDAAAAALSEWSGVGMFFGVQESDLSLAREIPVGAFTPELREEVLSIRLALAGQLRDTGDQTAADLRALLDEFAGTFGAEKRAAFAGFEGAIAQARGYTATAIHHWKAALKGSDSTRAQAHAGLSRAYPSGDAQAADHAERAADAFLQAGDRKAAARSLRRLAKCTLTRDPRRALETIDRALALLGAGLLERDLKGGLLHYKAVALEKLGAIPEALEAATQAADELRDLMGAEQERQAALALASLFAAKVGEPTRAEQFRQEAAALTASINDPRLQLRQAAGEVVLHYEPEAAARLVAEAERLGEIEVAALLTAIKAHHEGTPSERLQWLEEALGRLRTAKSPNSDVAVVLQALAHELMDQGEGDLAIRRYQEALAIDPFNHEARQNTAALLEQAGRWQDSVQFLEGQRELFGDKPGLLFALGKAYLNVGNVDAAATALILSKANAGENEDLRNRADQLAQEAVKQGGKPGLVKPAARRDVVTHAEFESRLQEFAQYIQAAQRMSLWKAVGKGDHKWVDHPEARAQDALGVFLSGCFQQRVQVYEAIAAGAGFVDLYVVGEEGFKAIVELKMLGRGYTSTYAFAGKEQIAHYMDQKDVRAGYLVLFDSRVRDFGKGIDPVVAIKANTVRVLFVDVRPDSPSKSHRSTRRVKANAVRVSTKRDDKGKAAALPKGKPPSRRRRPL